MKHIDKIRLLLSAVIICSVYAPVINTMNNQEKDKQEKVSVSKLREKFEKGGGKKPIQKTPEKKVTECQLCHKKFTNQDVNSVKLLCGHTFHEACIDVWFGTVGKDTLKWEDRNTNCPICGKNVRQKYETEKIEKLFAEAKIVDVPKGQGRVVRETRDYIIINEGGIERLYHKE